MRKAIFLATIFALLIFAGTAAADVCVIVKRTGSWFDDHTQGQINQMINAGVITQEEYDARQMPFDVVVVYEPWRCSADNPADNPLMAIMIRGTLDVATAQRYTEAWWDYTGELRVEDGLPERYVKRSRKFGFKKQNMPAALQNLIDNNGYLEVNWEDIRGYVEDKATGIVGQ